MDPDQLAAAICLDETPGGRLGPRERKECLEHHLGPLGILLTSPKLSAQRARWQDRRARSAWRARAEAFAARGGRFLPATDPAYPLRLTPFEWAPAWLYALGTSALPDRTVAIVGTRRATPSARELAAGLARGCATAGVCVISGLARGIDAAAHHGALERDGVTVAVLGTGVDRCYPAVNRHLYAAIAERGLLLSPFPPGAPPRREHFPQRNALLAALARAVVVIQAPARSGALLTAHHAAEIGCDVLAVPGDPILPENAGSNRLLAAGARVALGIEDVLSAVAGYEVPTSGVTTVAGGGLDPPLVPPIAAVDRRLLAELDLVPRAPDQLAVALDTPVTEVLAGLLRLELAGLVERLPGSAVRLTPRAARSARIRWADDGDHRRRRRPGRNTEERGS